MKILIVDDSKLVRLSVLKKLSLRLDSTILEAENGAQALARLAGVNVVLTDWHMPEMNGLRLLGKIRELPEGAAIAVLLMTAHNFTELERRELETQGFDGFIDKGSSAADMSQGVQLAFAKRCQPERLSRDRDACSGPKRLKLEGFNNLTKCLSFNLYDFVIARDGQERRAYLEYLERNYSSEHLAEISRGICKIIEAEVLDLSKQDYNPYGASTLVLMSDLKADSAMGSTVQAHLNKSHICAHTYPDVKSPNGICTFRVDLDIATCGEITPLTALNFMFRSFESDVVVIDYVVRGYTRDTSGRKVYNDLPFNSIRDFIDKEIMAQYQQFEDMNIPAANTWQTKFLTLDLKVAEYFLNEEGLKDPRSVELLKQLRREMKEIYYMLRVD